MLEPVQADGLELVLENFHDLLLGETNKLGGEVCDFGEDLTL